MPAAATPACPHSSAAAKSSGASCAATPVAELKQGPEVEFERGATYDDNYNYDGVPDEALLRYKFTALDTALSEVPAPLFGGRALLMMVAHSEVAIAVQRHSTYATSPFLRLWDTLCLAAALVNGSPEDRQTSLTYIGRKHDAIQGVEARTGCPYSANNVHAQLYVWACLVENVDLAYELLLQPQSSDFQQALYRDWKIWARQFGIPRHLIPPTRAALQCYMEAELAARLPLHEDSVRVMQTMYEIGSSPGKLPLFALPLYPLLAFYREFNVAALSSCATTFPLAQQVFTATGTREPLSLSTKLPFIIRAMRFLWGLMPRFVRILFFYFLNASMLPLGSRFRKRISFHERQQVTKHVPEPEHAEP